MSQKREPVLEPEEIAALMEKIAPDERTQAFFATLPPLPQPAHVEAFTYESEGPEGPDRYPLFAVIQQHLAEHMRDHCTEIFQRQISLDLESMEQQSYDEIIAGEGARAYLVFECDGFGSMLVAMDTPLIVSYVDALLGGTGEKHDGMDELSPVEERLAMRIAATLKAFLEASWQPIQPIEFKLAKIETDVEFLGVAAAGDSCFRSRFRVKFCKDVSGELDICYPRAFLEPILNKLRSNGQEKAATIDETWNRELEECLLQAPVELRLEMGSTRMNVGEFLNLKAGDYLNMYRRETDAVTLWLESVPMFQAVAGQRDGSLAAEIIDINDNGGKP